MTCKYCGGEMHDAFDSDDHTCDKNPRMAEKKDPMDFIFFINHKNKKTYRVLRPVLMKDPATREWVEAVEYSPEHDGRTIYVRELEDFKKKFVGLKL